MLTIIKIFSFIFSRLSPEVSLFFARILGRIYYLLDRRHRVIAYHNLRLALSDRLSRKELRLILKNYYLNIAQNMAEVLYSPRIDSGYIEKYIKIEGADYLRKVVEKNKSAVLISAHFGNWEIPNIVCKYLFPDKPYFVLARDQGMGKISALLDSYRQLHNYKVVAIGGSGLRKIIVNLQKGALLGMVIDQGIGRSSVLVDFFNHRVPAPTGAIKLAAKFQTPLLLTYIRRTKGPNLELKIFPALMLKSTSVGPEAIQESSQALNKTVEGFITRYPENYLWQFKRFKNKIDRKVLILSDAKTGHLRQSQSVAGILARRLEKKGLTPSTEIIEIKFKSDFARDFLACLLKLFGFLAAFKYLKIALTRDCFDKLSHISPDFVISAGSHISGINLIISKENQAKPIVIMKPAFFSTGSFELVISPWHDNLATGQNVLKVNAAPNLITEEYLEENSRRLKKRFSIYDDAQMLKIGLLLGGDTKDFTLTREMAEALCDRLLSLAKEFNAQILVSSSRRTSRQVEAILKDKFSTSSPCKLLIIASEENLPEAVGAILGICQIIVVSADSISMVSEAASSGKYTVVFNPLTKNRVSAKHQKFLQHLKENGYIYLSDLDIEMVIKKIWTDKPALKKLNDNILIQDALEKII